MNMKLHYSCYDMVSANVVSYQCVKFSVRLLKELKTWRGFCLSDFNRQYSLPLGLQRSDRADIWCGFMPQSLYSSCLILLWRQHDARWQLGLEGFLCTMCKILPFGSHVGLTMKGKKQFMLSLLPLILLCTASTWKLSDECIVCRLLWKGNVSNLLGLCGSSRWS